MNAFKKIFLDTTPIIYLLDNDKNFGEKTCKIFSALSEQKVKFVSSFITVAEYMVHPYRTKNESLVNAFWDLVTENNMILHPISRQEAIKAQKSAQNTNFSNQWIHCSSQPQFCTAATYF